MEKFKVNPDIVLREEYDDAGILFNPDNGKSIGLSPTAVFIYKRLDGKHTKEDILKELSDECPEGIPEEAPRDYDEFIASLQEKGYLSVQFS